MAATEWTLTRGSDEVTTTSSATRDYLLTQGWADASNQALEPVTSLMTLERQRLFGTSKHGPNLVPNGDFEEGWVGTLPSQDPIGDWGDDYWHGARTYAGPDTDVFHSGRQSWRQSWSSVGGAGFTTPVFMVNPGATVHLEWWTRHDTNNAIVQEQFMTTDGQQRPGIGHTPQESTSYPWSGALAPGVWHKHTRSHWIPQGQWLCRVALWVEPVSPALGSVWLDDVRITIENNPTTSSGVLWDSHSWIAPTLSSPFVNYGDVWEPTGYKKIAGVTYLRGLLNTTGAVAGGSTIFTLPAGYRPEHNSHLVVATGVSPWTTLINVMSTGVVRLNQPIGSGQWLSLANVQFPAAW